MKNAKRILVTLIVLALSFSLTLSVDAWQYTVKPGDSMWKISRSNGVSLDDMINANPQVENPNLIYPGDVLEVPSDETAEYGSTQAREVLDLTNSYRANKGLSALTLDSELCAVAQAKADDMAAKGYFSHTSPTYGTPSQMLNAFGVQYGYMGENIAKGYTDAASVMNGWMNSEGHRANILNGNFQKLGVGYSASGNIWVQIFTGRAK